MTGTIAPGIEIGAGLLCALYARPRLAKELAPSDWGRLLGAARRARTLAHIGLRLRTEGVTVDLDPLVMGHMDSVAVVVRYQRQMILREACEIARALRPVGGSVVLLKGAAYIVAGLPLAFGRRASDIDILVEARAIAQAEAFMRAGGWTSSDLNTYDDRYYRQWSHELPPFVHPDRGIEVDVHHSITPAMRGPGVDTDELIEKSIEVEFDGHRRFRVLQPVDQLIHCALHTFKDSDLSLRLRESMDFDLLYRHYVELNPELPDELVARALELNQARPLWWAIHFARRWLGSPIPERTLERLPAPSASTVRVMNWLCDRAMLPGLRMERTGLDRVAAIALLARYQYQRLPLTKLIPHVLEKSRRRLMPHKEQPGAP